MKRWENQNAGQPEKIILKGKVNNMKKLFKMFSTVALAATLAIGMPMAANATSGSYTITINDADGAANSSIGNTYTLYKVAGFDVSGGVYTNIQTTTEFASLQADLVDLNGKAKDSTEAVAFANNAAAIAKESSTNAGTLEVEKDNKTFSVTETGYYLVVDTAHANTNPYLTTKYMLVAVDGLDSTLKAPDTNENIYVKTSTADVDKKIVSEHGGVLEDADTVAVNDIVTYQLDATIPTYADNAEGINYLLTDVMSNGLTYKGIESVKVSSDGKTWTNATYNTTDDSDAVDTAGATVKIKLTDDHQLINNTYVRVVLKAMLNSNANKGESGNPNSVDLTYSNNYFGGGDSYTTPEDTVITYTGELKIVKVDEENKETKLSGAVFDIYRVATANEIADEGVEKETIKINGTDTLVIKVGTTDATGEDGKTSVPGLDVGTYYAVETVAPEGYSVDSTPIPLELTVVSTDPTLDANGDMGEGDKVTNYTDTSASEANKSVVENYKVTWKTEGEVEKSITNKKGLTLPGTGGIGTTIFTAGGLALVVLAGVLFIVYMKKQKRQA